MKKAVQKKEETIVPKTRKRELLELRILLTKRELQELGIVHNQLAERRKTGSGNLCELSAFVDRLLKKAA